MTELTPWLVTLLAFGAVSSLTFLVVQLFATQVQLHRRRAQSGSGEQNLLPLLDNVRALVATYFDEKRFGVEGKVRANLRRDLIRAGYFRVDAISHYIFFKLALVTGLPILAYAAVATLISNVAWPLKMLLVVVATAMAILGPDAYIARRQRKLTEQYRTAFPDLLDLMVVCVDAGLSLEAALERLSSDMILRQRELGTHLLILGAEARAGRSLADALESFAERLGLDEAGAFVAMLRQSIELGTDVGAALRVFSDEMRDKRLLRAEERANQLPVKMVLPLGLFIFPVILMTIMVPVVLRLLSIMHH
jgi:tight adherence protein C